MNFNYHLKAKKTKTEKILSELLVSMLGISGFVTVSVKRRCLHEPRPHAHANLWFVMQ